MNWNNFSPNNVLKYASCETILSTGQAFQLAKKMPATVQIAACGGPYSSAVNQRPVKSNTGVSSSQAPISLEDGKM